MTPLAEEVGGGSAGDGKKLDPFARAALESLEAEAIMPTHAEDKLAAISALGAKTSGDIYTHSDLSLLAAISERMGSRIARFDGDAKRHALERYVPGAIADQLAEGDSPESGERFVTLLFVDIRGYTGYAHQREVAEVFSLINRYTELVSEIVHRHGGSVVEFSGDGLMAVFGAPKALENMEKAAVNSSLEVLDALEHARLGSADASEPLRVGIGIATGPAYVGNIQTADRMIWSALGDTTNLAARLQGLTRDLDVRVVIDDVTRRAAGHSAAMFRAVDGQAIRGRKNEDIHVY
jgi:class 3 adenylate cyclase